MNLHVCHVIYNTGFVFPLSTTTLFTIVLYLEDDINFIKRTLPLVYQELFPNYPSLLFHPSHSIVLIPHWCNAQAINTTKCVKVVPLLLPLFTRGVCTQRVRYPDNCSARVTIYNCICMYKYVRTIYSLSGILSV